MDNSVNSNPQPADVLIPITESRASGEGNFRLVAIGASIAVFVLVAVLFFYDELTGIGNQLSAQLDSTFYLFVLAGFIAQMIDGALGMAYGVSASTFLLSFGVPPAAASASIHTAEIFTSGVSGLSHLKFRNVNKKLFRSLLIPGVIGAVAGAYLLTSFEDYNYILKPVIACYTLVLGVVIIRKALRSRQVKSKTRNIPGLAAFGGGKTVIFEHHTAFKGHNAHAFIFFRRHCNTSFCCDS